MIPFWEIICSAIARYFLRSFLFLVIISSHYSQRWRLLAYNFPLTTLCMPSCNTRSPCLLSVSWDSYNTSRPSPLFKTCQRHVSDPVRLSDPWSLVSVLASRILLPVVSAIIFHGGSSVILLCDWPVVFHLIIIIPEYDTPDFFFFVTQNNRTVSLTLFLFLSLYI